MTRIETSFHEAGHAVIAHLLGKPEYGAIVHGAGSGTAGTGDLSTPCKLEDYTPKTTGDCHLNTLLSGNDGWFEVFKDMTITAAGYAAASMATNQPVIVLTGPDRISVASAIGLLFPEAAQDFETHRAAESLAIARARYLLHTNWPSVERVALALDTRGRLSAEEVAELMRTPATGTE